MSKKWQKWVLSLHQCQQRQSDEREEEKERGMESMGCVVNSKACSVNGRITSFHSDFPAKIEMSCTLEIHTQ